MNAPRPFAVLLDGSRPIRYLLVGMLNTGFSFAIYCLGLYAGLSIAWASLAAVCLGIVFSFFTQGTWVFRHTSLCAFLAFALNWFCMYCLHLGVVYGLQSFGVSPYLGGAAAMFCTTSVSYFVLRDLVFRVAGASADGHRPR